MSYPSEPAGPLVALEAIGDPGLGRFMAHVYAKVAAGFVLSALAAWTVGSLPAMIVFLTPGEHGLRLTELGLVLVFSPLVVLLAASFALRQPVAGGATLFYLLVAILVGGSLGLLVLIYLGGTLTNTFLIAAAAFVGLSAFAATKPRHLSGRGHFLAVAMFGFILASLVNALLGNGIFYFALDTVGVQIIAMLFAAVSPTLVQTYHHLENRADAAAASSFGALMLYLNLLNPLQSLSPRGSDANRKTP